MAMMNLSSIAHAKEPSAADFACHFQVDNIEKKVEINRFEGEHFLGRCGYPCNYDLANLAAIRSAKDAGFDEVSCHEVSRATESYWGSHNHDSINFGICQRCHSVVECNKPSERTLSQDEI
ncbi:MAG: hypothetical protein ACXWOH_10270, partial [Bdellovibrionota bacterium]